MPPRYKDLSECRSEIRRYANKLEAGSDDADPELRDHISTDRYTQDLRWFDEWLDAIEISSARKLSAADANNLGQTLSLKFNGSTGLFRWNRIYAFYSWLQRMDMIDSNPLDKWHSDKKEEFGLTRSTEQSRKLDDERYATNEDEVRLMEENVGRHLIRDQLIIRCLWQMGMRRGELAGIELRDIEREDREVTIREQVAKNDEMRVVAYQSSLDGLMEKWLDEGRREEMAAGAEHGRFLVGERGAPLSGDRINDVVKEAAQRAGINELLYADANATEDEEGTKEKNRWKISAHAIRHGFGTYLVHETDAGLWEVSQAMGHHSVKVTEGIYVDDDPRAGIDHVHMYGPD